MSETVQQVQQLQRVLLSLADDAHSMRLTSEPVLADAFSSFVDGASVPPEAEETTEVSRDSMIQVALAHIHKLEIAHSVTEDDRSMRYEELRAIRDAEYEAKLAQLRDLPEKVAAQRKLRRAMQSQLDDLMVVSSALRRRVARAEAEMASSNARLRALRQERSALCYALAEHGATTKDMHHRSGELGDVLATAVRERIAGLRTFIADPDASLRNGARLLEQGGDDTLTSIDFGLAKRDTMLGKRQPSLVQAALQSVAGKYFHALERIFRYYTLKDSCKAAAVADGMPMRMTLKSFTKFVQDTKTIVPKILPQSKVDMAYFRTAERSGQMALQHFIASLARLASLRYWYFRNVSVSFELYLVTDVLPRASETAGLDIPRSLELDEALRAAAPDTAIALQPYAAENEPGVYTLQRVLDFLNDKAVTTDRLTLTDCILIFAQSQAKEHFADEFDLDAVLAASQLNEFVLRLAIARYRDDKPLQALRKFISACIR